MNVRYRVTLETSERVELVAMVLGGKGPVRRLKRAQILLASDKGSTDEEIARNIAVGTSTVYRTKQRFVEEGLERALSELPRPGADRKLGVVDESLLVAVACSKPPEGRSRWTLQLLADEMVRLTVHDSVSDETIRRRLGELQLKPWQEKMWCIPQCGIRTIPIAETGGCRSPKPDHGDHRNRAWRSPKPGIPITETGDGDRLTSVVRPLPDLR